MLYNNLIITNDIFALCLYRILCIPTMPEKLWCGDVFYTLQMQLQLYMFHQGGQGIHFFRKIRSYNVLCLSEAAG